MIDYGLHKLCSLLLLWPLRCEAFMRKCSVELFGIFLPRYKDEHTEKHSTHSKCDLHMKQVINPQILGYTEFYHFGFVE